MSKFTIPSFDIDTFAESGHGYLDVNVDGFWSSPITVRVDRGWADEKKWSVTVTHSSGGYDSKSGISQLDTELNFAEALIASVEFARNLESKFDKLEENYQRYRALLAAHHEAEKARKAAELETDPGFEQWEAEAIVDTMLTEANSDRCESVHRVFYERGSNNKVVFYCEKFGTKAVFKEVTRRGLRYTARVSKKDLINDLMVRCSRRKVETAEKMAA